MKKPKLSVVHYNCTKYPDRGGNPEYLPTGKRASADKTDKTQVYACEHCKQTVGVELLSDGTIVVYI